MATTTLFMFEHHLQSILRFYRFKLTVIKEKTYSPLLVMFALKTHEIATSCYSLGKTDFPQSAISCSFLITNFGSFQEHLSSFCGTNSNKIFSFWYT